MRGAIVLLAGLALEAPATAAPPLVTATATPSAGTAPLRVTLTAAGDAATYAWDLGDGTAATGPVVTHVYLAGRFVATVTATNVAGESAQAQVQVAATARALALTAPRSADFGAPATLSGSLQPSARGSRVQIYRGRTFVTSARVRAEGRFRARVLLRSPGPYQARWGSVRSPARTVLLRPRIEVALPPLAPVGGTLTLQPRLVPLGAGTLSVRVLRGRTLVRARSGSLSTTAPATYRVELASTPSPGFAAARRTVGTQVVQSVLERGFKGGFAIHGYPSVPANPASHGCVRVPMWIAPSLYGEHGFGTTVVVHL